VALGNIAAGAVYPYIQWDVNLATCGAEPLTFGDDTAMVRADYTTTGGAGRGFAYGYGPNLTAGPFCAVACQNGGQCVSGACVCATGFSGTACETNDDDCAGNPCQNGGTCIDGAASYTCDCSGTGYEGTDCDVDIDECATNNGGCADAGSCTNTVGGFSCSACPAGFWGPSCTADCPVETCPGTPICDFSTGTYLGCVCPDGFFGDTCSLQARVWYRADALALTDGADVTSWPDSGGSANQPLALFGGATAPTFHEDVLGGHPVVRFAQGGPLQTGDFVLQDGADDFTFVLVLRAGSTQGGAADVFSNHHAGTPLAGPCMESVAGGNTMDVYWHTGSTWMAASTFDLSETRFEIHVVSKAGTTTTHDVNGVTISSVSVDATTAQPPGPLGVGGYPGSGSRNWNGDLAELAYFNFGLDAAERAELTDLLAQKYAADDCAGNPCQNGGTCVDGFDSYTCSCVGGYIGDNCEVAWPPPGFSCTGTVCANDTTGEVAVPAGDFWMGCNSTLDGDCGLDESSQHLVALSEYAIDSTEVSAAEYKACVTAGGCTLPSATGGTYGTYDPAQKQDHPINFVNWSQASAYCAWAGKPAGAQRLCTEAEWEKAARGGCDTVTGDCSDGSQMRKYPWDAGDGSASVEPTDCAFANWSGCGVGTYTQSIGTYDSGASPYGAKDMAGNVWEWVSDWYAGSYAAGAVTDPMGPESGSDRVLRGGDFVSGAVTVRASERGIFTPSSTSNSVGIRCCRSLP